MKEKLTLVVVGPTAVGKSNFVYSRLVDFSPHVISADSMQIYKGLDIATATPGSEILARFPHTGINELPPGENYNVARFLDRAEQGISEAHLSGDLPVVVGGTAMYVKKFLFGLDEMPDANPKFRRRMAERAEAEGKEKLHEELAEIDPEAAEKIHPNDRKRVIRALEIHHETGRTKTELTAGQSEIRADLEPYVVGLNRPREELHERIVRRIEKMVDAGLVDEVSELLQQGQLNKNIKQAIGFKEAVKFLEGEFELEEMKEEMVARTKQFVRKQLTWFRKLPVDLWGHPDLEGEELVDKIAGRLE